MPTDLLDKLPHKFPALLLESVREVDAAGASCPLISGPSPLAPEGKLPGALALEAMAQAAAVWIVWSHPGESARGMLVQCRDFVLKRRVLELSGGLEAKARPVSVGSPTGINLFSGSVTDAAGLELARATFMIHTRKGDE